MGTVSTFHGDLTSKESLTHADTHTHTNSMREQQKRTSEGFVWLIFLFLLHASTEGIPARQELTTNWASLGTNFFYTPSRNALSLKQTSDAAATTKAHATPSLPSSVPSITYDFP